MGIVRIGDAVPVVAAKAAKQFATAKNAKSASAPTPTSRVRSAIASSTPLLTPNAKQDIPSKVETSTLAAMPVSMPMSAAEMASQLPVMRDRFGNVISQEICTPKQRRKNAAALSALQASAQPAANTSDSLSLAAVR